jgi:hypothetical protein
MTEKKFWKMIQEHLEFPFDIEDVVKIEPDLLGGVYIDLQDGVTHTLSFGSTDNDND